ncbi:MAG: hypothetical protein GVY36_02535 [Verrucomicrobia bacterium]|nr:hypothetical protein [Verrucomicrobiota bacterium]
MPWIFCCSEIRSFALDRLEHGDENFYKRIAVTCGDGPRHSLGIGLHRSRDLLSRFQP